MRIAVFCEASADFSTAAGLVDRLRDKDDRAPRSAKRILAVLTRGDPDREARCWTETSLAVLRARGEHSGLCAFLDEVIERLLPSFGRPAR